MFSYRLEAVLPSPSLELFVSSTHWIDAWSGHLDDHVKRLLDGLIDEPADVSDKRNKTADAGRSRRIQSPLRFGLIALLGIAALAIVSFSNPLKHLAGFGGEAAAPALSGSWVTSSLPDPYDDKGHYHLSFDLDPHGQDLSGGVSEIEDETHKGMTTQYPILGGKLDGDAFSFHTDFEVMEGDETKPASQFYEGKVLNGELKCRRWNNVEGGGTIETFSAKRPLPAGASAKPQ